MEAYRAYKPMPYDVPTQAMAAALCAAGAATNAKDTLFDLSESGTIEVQPGGKTVFTKSASGNHRYSIADAARKDEIIKAYTTLASNEPIIPPPRVPPANRAATKTP